MKAKMYKSLTALSVIISAFFSTTVIAQTGSNPIIRDVFTADPAAMVYNDKVYLYVGHDEAKDGEMFTMHDWLCYTSTDMKTWTKFGSIMKATDFKWAKGDAWASQVIEKNGKFYFYVTVTGANQYSGRAVGVAVGNSPTGPFVDARGTPLVSENMTQNGKAWDDIDPTVFIDDDGQAYLSWGNPFCYFAKLKPNMTEIDGAITRITPPNYGEAPWLHKRNGIYYLTYAAFVAPTNSEQICYATATSINGPWTYRGILTGTAKNSYTIHPAIIEFKGQPYFFYHNATLTLNGQGPALGRRSVCLEYLCYNADGTIKPITQTTAGVTVAPPCQTIPVAQSPFKGSPFNIPGRIEAEDYDLGGEGVSFHEASTNGNQGGASYRNDQVDIEATKDVDGSYNVSYIQNGEWLEYTVNVSAAGKYDLSLRVAADGAGKSMHAEIDGQNLTGAITIPNTGGYQTWETVLVSGLSLTAGKHTLRLAFDADYFNINYIRFDKTTTTSIDEEDYRTSKLVYPNPFNHSFTVDLHGEFNYQLFDVTGLEMKQGTVVGSATLGEDLSGGVYFLKLNSAQGNKTVKLLKR